MSMSRVGERDEIWRCSGLSDEGEWIQSSSGGWGRRQKARNTRERVGNEQTKGR